MKQFTATTNEEGVRLSRFVEKVTVGLPSGVLYKSFRNRRIKVNGKRQQPDYRIMAGDVIELYLVDDFFPKQTEQKPRPKKAKPLTIVRQDENVAFLYKPAHLLCHSDRTGDANLVDLFIDHLLATGEYRPSGGAPFKPAICNRLDRGTEGLVLAAKTYQALRDATAIIREGFITKQYLAIAAHRPPEGRLSAFLKHDEAKNRVFVYKRAASDRKPIETGIEVLCEKNGFSLCRITLYTGRTHQIRAHLAFLGCPLLGDRKYGDKDINAAHPSFTDQALCAVQMSFDQIPPENTLCYLNGETVKLENPELLRRFAEL